ncbi:hypothetical protein PAECIP111893_05115 [Paenibacillus plantiphilus]|uniref:Uncharacterized protein n=1 Tax=Paenibacillus plantiphilus TaxID=2905650 RepID=A0ABM9CU21_9BACL|nr:hypothetical protein [Paenibacillus plantiphilus]CAH1224398.1 hypothetical protein PAECIP111893_05115 [Paenibacillus plantiphilus]
MRRFVNISLFMVLIVALVGCQSGTETTMPEAKMFSVHIDAPEGIQADKPFIVKGNLVNNSDTSWNVEHGADMFTYEVTDGNGEPVLQPVKHRVVNGIGIGTALKPDMSYSYNGEGHVQPRMDELIVQAGSYSIVSKAKFTINYEDKRYEFEVESAPLKFKVT